MAPVPQAEFGFGLEPAARLPGADHVAGVVLVAVHEPVRLGTHGGEADDPLLVAVLVLEREEVGAFEHEHVRVGVLEQHGLERPLDHVLGGVQPHLAALVGGGDAVDHVPGIAGLPDLRVAEVPVDLLARAVDDHAELGDMRDLVIVRHGHQLHLPFAAGVVHAVGPAVAGVVEAELAVVADDGRAGEHAVLFLFEARCHRDRFAAPRDHVLAGDMSPVHRPPFGAVRVQLVEDVPAALVVAQAVRVVDPAAVGGDVEFGVPAVVARRRQFGHAEFGLGQFGVVVCDRGEGRSEVTHRCVPF